MLGTGLASHRIASHRIASHRIASHLFLLTFLLLPQHGLATPLGTSAQLGVSRAYVADGVNFEHWTVWARRSDQNLVAVRSCT